LRRITKRVYRQTSQDVCPWNQRFARELPEGSPFAPREALAGEDARTPVRKILAMDVEPNRAAFRGSPTKRAKLRVMQRNAAVVLGNVGTAEDVDVLARARRSSHQLSDLRLAAGRPPSPAPPGARRSGARGRADATRGSRPTAGRG
jgi:epoxyqueuosine reductase